MTESKRSQNQIYQIYVQAGEGVQSSQIMLKTADILRAARIVILPDSIFSKMSIVSLSTSAEQFQLI